MPSEHPRPRVLVITQYYAPDPNFITQAVASLLAEDAEVTVLTSHPNCPAGHFTPGHLWPESFVSAGVVREGALVRASFGYRRWINRWADLIICSTRDTFALEGMRAAALECVPIWVEGIPESLPPARAERESRIVYAGNLGPTQSLDTLVRAAALVRDEAPQLRFEIYGMGSEEDSLRRLTASLGATNVKFMGSVSPEDAFRVASTSMAQVVSLRPTELFRMTIPSKLVFSFAAGTVILAGLEGESESLATESGGAIVYQAGRDSAGKGNGRRTSVR